MAALDRSLCYKAQKRGVSAQPDKGRRIALSAAEGTHEPEPRPTPQSHSPAVACQQLELCGVRLLAPHQLASALHTARVHPLQPPTQAREHPR